MVFISNSLNPFQLLARIKAGWYDFRAMFTFLIIFSFSFFIGFVKIKFKSLKIGKARKSFVNKDKRGGI